MILIVDDTPEVCWLYAEKLKTSGFQVETAMTAEGALTRLIAGEFRTAFMDVSLPGMSGVEVAARAREAGCDIPIVAITGVVITPEQKALARFSEIFAKPIAISILPDLARKYVKP